MSYNADHYYNTIPITPINPRKCSRIEGEIWKSADWLVSKSVTDSEITGTRHGVTDSERDDATTGTSRNTMTKNKNEYSETETIRKVCNIEIWNLNQSTKLIALNALAS